MDEPENAAHGVIDSWTGLPIDLAPRDGTIVRLCVDYTDVEPWLPLEDANIAWTIGGNNYDNDGENEWRFAGWSWQQDVWCEGSGKVLGWAPFDNAAISTTPDQPAIGQAVDKAPDRAELRRIAEAATQGNWSVIVPDRGYRFDYVVTDHPSVAPQGEDRFRHMIAECDCGKASENAAHIAALDPLTAIALLDHLAALEAALTEIAEDFGDFADGEPVERAMSLWRSMAWEQSSVASLALARLKEAGHGE